MNGSLAGRIVLCLAIALALTACPPPTEKPEEISELPEPPECPEPDCPDLDMLLNDKKVKIEVKDGEITSKPMALDLCKRRDACKTAVWYWDKRDDSDVTRLEIRRTRTTEGAEACFDSDTYSLEYRVEQPVTVQEGCPPKSAWLYDIIPYCGADPCPPDKVKPLDPGMIIGG